MSISEENINMLWASLIVEELIRNGVTYFCISPGSRSTPLTVAAARHPEAQCIICYDERGAAFHALGYARGSGKPAALICTSGTAAANYYPAVIEASMDFVPMIILTADRPPELRETGANQTIRQPRIYGDYCRWQFDMPVPDEKITPRMVLTTVDQLVYRATNSPPGPTHLNCMFREPLAPQKEKISEKYLKPVESWLNSDKQYSEYKHSQRHVHADELDDVTSMINNAKRGLLVIGRLKRAEEVEAVKILIDKLKWPVFADILSGLSLGKQSKYVIPYYDRLLKSENFCKLAQADVILHIGGITVSKRLIRFIEELSPEHYIMINNNPNRLDPAHDVTTRIEAAPELFCSDLLTTLNTNSDENRVAQLFSMSQQTETVFEHTIDKQNNITEPGIARVISQLIPENSGLYLANSLPVREFDLFAHPAGHRVTVGCNRGVSGIDGTIASATGFAAGLTRPVTLLIGDLAFIHDINSLLLAKSINQPLVIVLINNHGGGIFQFLPIAEHRDVFEKYFATPHSLSFEFAARQFDITYEQPQYMLDFKQAYQIAIKRNLTTLIEMQSNQKENVDFFHAIQTKIKANDGDRKDYD